VTHCQCSCCPNPPRGTVQDRSLAALANMHECPAPPVTIRPARADDAPSIWSVHARAVRMSAVSHYTGAEVDAWANRVTPESYVDAMRTRRLVVAEMPGRNGPRIVGFGQLHPGEGIVEAIYVDPACERQGIGTALFRALERDARAAGLPGLLLDASLNSVPFYEAMGCRQEGLDRHELAPGVHIACAVMDKRFAPASA